MEEQDVPRMARGGGRSGLGGGCCHQQIQLYFKNKQKLL